jgi:hypothetical protein
MVYLVKLKQGDPMVVVSSLVSSIYRAIEEKQKAAIVDNEWFNWKSTSDRLKKYSLSLFDSSVVYSRTAFFYGKGNQVLDLTDKVPSKIPVDYDLNLIMGKPSNQVNEIFLAYTLNDVEFTEKYSEKRNSPIYTDLTQLTAHTDFFWMDKAKLELYDSILKGLVWKEKGECPKGANLIHVLTPSDLDKPALYPKLLAKYKEILLAHVSGPLLLIQTHPDLESFLVEKGYTYTVLDPKDPLSFSVALQCTGSFVGNFNLETLTGSFTSYYLHVVSNCKQSILVDLEHLNEN